MEVYTYEAKSSINQNNNISLSVSFAPKQQLVNKEDGGVCVEVYKSIKKIGDILPSISNFSDEIKTWVSAKLSSIDNALLEPYKKINMMDYVSKEVKEIPLLLKNW